MPTYGYRCRNCDHNLDAFQKITDQPLQVCPNCGKEALQRGPGGGIGLIFKGSGFYKTEYAPTIAPKEEIPKDTPAKGGCACGQPKSCSSA